MIKITKKIGLFVGVLFVLTRAVLAATNDLESTNLHIYAGTLHVEGKVLNIRYIEYDPPTLLNKGVPVNGAALDWSAPFQILEDASQHSYDEITACCTPEYMDSQSMTLESFTAYKEGVAARPNFPNFDQLADQHAVLRFPFSRKTSH